ncbi:Leucine-rich repeat serine/threonine-protein kinase 2 [Hondaea fermentalgiana]|uniref:non-specific serine/threonine protein kinase n=1 Tax=Hondaea fermentalgiana TaxID=2315210 RepID=A0A2R5GNV1_9STRA|nr:Leucine-rich repeat serine/threonine-protein kinase 2 [Hondaea fermentalgiana]|eukprot:GBG32567.1 Leucine-rich repeat serine/threonine-protein kinase 2 [Hondaea fermentalgiana]
MSGKSRDLYAYDHGGDLEETLMLPRSKSGKRKSSRKIREETRTVMSSSSAPFSSDRAEGYVSGGSRRSRRRWTGSRRKPRAQRRAPGVAALSGPSADGLVAGETAEPPAIAAHWPSDGGLDTDEPGTTPSSRRSSAGASGYWPASEGALAPKELSNTTSRSSPTSGSPSSAAATRNSIVRDPEEVLEALGQQTAWRPGLVLPNALSASDGSLSIEAIKAQARPATIQESQRDARGATDAKTSDQRLSNRYIDGNADDFQGTDATDSDDESDDLSDDDDEDEDFDEDLDEDDDEDDDDEDDDAENEKEGDELEREEGEEEEEERDANRMRENETARSDLGLASSPPVPIGPSNGSRARASRNGLPPDIYEDVLLINRGMQSPFGSLGSGPESTRLGQIDASGDASGLLADQKKMNRRRRAKAAAAAAAVGSKSPSDAGPTSRRSRLARREAQSIIREWRESRTLVSVELSLRNRGLSSVPGLRDLARDEIANKRLGILDLDHNALKKLPQHLLSLSNLTELHVDYNKLTEASFPANMSSLHSLTLLSASHNHIREFPRAFVTLPALEYLDLRDNDLERLVPERDADQFITALFSSLGRTLKSLDLGMNNLHGTLDVRFCEAILKIEQLSLHTNQLTAFPECFKFMDNLRVLRANGNLLLQVPPLSIVSSGPAAVRKFFHSLSKDNTRNAVGESPGERSRASSGGSLAYSRNLASSSAAVASASNEETDVGDSASVTDASAALLERSNSNVSASSAGLATDALKGLGGGNERPTNGELAVAPDYSHADDAPSSRLGALTTADEHVRTDDNTDDTNGSGGSSLLAAALSGKGSGATTTTLEEPASPVTQQRRSFKVVVLGNSEAGKTSLIKTLVSGCSSGTTKSEDRAFGVDIHSFELRGGTQNDQVETLDMWDFAGQSVYYRTHQIFLSRRTLYLLVWDVSKHQQAQIDMEVCFWVYSVQARIPGAVILIIAAKTDLVTPEVLAQRKRELRERLNQHETWRKRDLADMAREEELEECNTDIGDMSSTMSVVSAKTSSTRLRRHMHVPVSADAQSVIGGASAGAGAGAGAGASTAGVVGVGLDEENEADSGLDDYHELRPRILLRQRPRVLEEIIDVSSISGSGFDALRVKLMEVVRDPKLFPHVGSLACLPRAWTVVEDAIGKLQAERQSRPVCSWAELETAVAARSEELGLDLVESGDVVQCVQFLNDIGHIVHNRSVDMVVLNPNWIVNCIKRIVDQQSIEKRLMEKLALHNTNQPSVAARRVARMRLSASPGSSGLGGGSEILSRQSSTGSTRSTSTGSTSKRPARARRRKVVDDSKIFGDVNRLKDKGILSESLLKCLWPELFSKGRSRAQQKRDEAIYEGLVRILEQFDVCSELALSPTNERQWIIPCLITKSIDIERRWSKPDPRCEQAIQIGRSFVFPRFKPPGLMDKILTTVSKQFPQSKAEIRSWKDASLIRILDAEGSQIKLLVRQKQEQIFSCTSRVNASLNIGEGSEEGTKQDEIFDMERSVLDICAWGPPQTALHKMWYNLSLLQDAIEDILIYEYMGITWFYMVRCPVCMAHLKNEDDFSAAHTFDIRDVEEKQDRQADLVEQNWRDYFENLNAQLRSGTGTKKTDAGSGNARTRPRRIAPLCRTMCDTESKHIPSHECPLMWLAPPPPEIEYEFMADEDDLDASEMDESAIDPGNNTEPPSLLPGTGANTQGADARNSASEGDMQTLVARTMRDARELAHEYGQSNQMQTLLSAPTPASVRPSVPPGLRALGPSDGSSWALTSHTEGVHGRSVEDFGLSVVIRPDQHLLQLQSGKMLDARAIVRIGVYCDQRRRFLESGSGFVMDRDRGFVVTACHLVTEPRSGMRKFGFGPKSSKRIIVALFSSQDSLPVWRFEASIVASGEQGMRNQPPSFATGAATGTGSRSSFLDLLVLRLEGQVHETFNETGLENSVWGKQIHFEAGPPLSEALPLPADLPIANSSLVNIGDSVALIGFPLSRGAAETICMDKGSVQGFSQNRMFINAALFNLEGSSGGPLVNENGEVIGVLSTAVSNSLGVHVAINRIIPLLEQVYSYVMMAALNASAMLQQQRAQKHIR